MAVLTVFVQNDFIEGAVPFYTAKKFQYVSGRAVKQLSKKAVRIAQKANGWPEADLSLDVQIEK